MNKRNTNKIRLTERDLHRIIKESVKRVISEASDSVSVQPFGNNEDNSYSVSPEEELRGNEFIMKHHPWTMNPDCKTLEGLINWGYYCQSDFESGKLSIGNYLSDLHDMI